MAKPKGGMGVVIMMGKPRLGPDAGGNGADDAPFNTPERRRQHAADVEADFLGRPQPHGTFDADNDSGRVSASTAGYMELEGAQKSGDCDLVDVPGGVSGERGCCNLYAPRAGATEFCCGECAHFEAQTQAAAAPIPEAVNGQ